MVQVDRLSLKLAADLGIIHVLLSLQTYRIKDLWGYGGFHPDFKGKLGASKV
jgi:hypothetical protein